MSRGLRQTDDGASSLLLHPPSSEEEEEEKVWGGEEGLEGQRTVLVRALIVMTLRKKQTAPWRRPTLLHIHPFVFQEKGVESR